MATRLLSNLWRRLFGGSGQLLEATGAGPDTNAPNWNREPRDVIQDIPYRDYRTTVAFSRRLFANLDILKAAASEKAMHAVGRAWTPVFKGGGGSAEALAWGEQASAWLENEWFKLCDVRGRDDFRTGLYLDSCIIDRDGESPLLFTENDEGYPLLQRIPCHRIGQIGSVAMEVGEEAVTYINGEEVMGAYKGLTVEQGVIYNEAGRAVAYRIMGPNAQAQQPQDISARDMDVCGEPEYADQGRCLPAISGSINFFASYLKSHTYEQQALEIAGSIALIESNATGGADMSDPAVANAAQALPATTGRPIIEKHMGGSIRYVKSSDPNAKVDAFRNAARPGAEWDSFNDRIIRTGVSTIWPYSLVWKPEGMNGTQERSCIERARALVKDRQDLLMPRAVRAVGYAVSKAIKLGILPPYPGNDLGGFLKWGFEMPAEFSIDHGREDSQAVDMYRAGFSTMQQWLDANQRGSFEDHTRARAREAARRQKIIAEVETEEGVKIDPREIQMLTPNDQPATAPSENPPPATAAPVTQSDPEQP